MTPLSSQTFYLPITMHPQITDALRAARAFIAEHVSPEAAEAMSPEDLAGFALLHLQDSLDVLEEYRAAQPADGQRTCWQMARSMVPDHAVGE